MAILVIFTGTISKAQYEALRKEVGWEKNQPAGGIFHAAAFDRLEVDRYGDIRPQAAVVAITGERDLVFEIAVDQLQATRLVAVCRELKEAELQPLALQMKELSRPLDGGSPRMPQGGPDERDHQRE